MVGYLRQNHFAEYAASHIFTLCGFAAQQTLIGVYQGRNCVYCEDFVSEDEELWTLEKVLGMKRSLLQWNYSRDEILALLHIADEVTGLDATSFYFDLYVLDALLANWDRHCQNWGFLRKDGKFRFSPVYDNAGCLYSYADSLERIQDTLTYPVLLKNAIEDYPSTRLRAHSGYTSFFYVFQEEYPEIDEAVLRVYPRIDLEKIISFLNEETSVEPLRLRYYEALLRARYEQILTPRYQHALRNKR